MVVHLKNNAAIKSENRPQTHLNNASMTKKKMSVFTAKRPYAKITRHLKQKHSGEGEIAKALSYKQGSSMQSLLLTKVRNMGNYQP